LHELYATEREEVFTFYGDLFGRSEIPGRCGTGPNPRNTPFYVDVLVGARSCGTAATARRRYQGGK
jgi:hypothetical protein